MPVVQHAIDIAAPADVCWQRFADLARWPRWFPFLRAVEGTLALGGQLTLRVGSGPAVLPIRVRIEELVAGERVRWVGGKMGMTGDHSYTFASKAPGLTRVTSREEIGGFASRMMAGPLLAKFDDEVHASMARLKALVEAAR